MGHADNSKTEDRQGEQYFQPGRVRSFADSLAVYMSRCTADVAVQREPISTEEVDGVAAKHGLFARFEFISFEGKG
jgi:hypothetical protein